MKKKIADGKVYRLFQSLETDFQRKKWFQDLMGKSGNLGTI